MTTAEATAPATPQIEGANFLNLLIVDDERAIRDCLLYTSPSPRD